MPPAPSAVADYGYHLVDAMREHLRISVVLPADQLARARIPDGVARLSIEEALHGHLDQPDLHIYHVGNHPAFHGWMLEAISTNPGIVVLHDLSLLDFYRGLCDGSPALWNHLITRQGYDAGLSHSVVVDGVQSPDRMAYTFTGDIVPVSIWTITHSQWAASHLSAMYPGARVTHVPLATTLLEEDESSTLASGEGLVTITVLGGIHTHKRVDVALRAFARAATNRPDARIVIVGRADNPGLVRSLRALAHDLGIEAQTQFLLDVSQPAFEQALRDAHLVVTLRWPTAGETSAVLMQALGAGRVVLTSDVPQFAEYDPLYVRRVEPEQPGEVDQVAAIMRDAIDHPALFRRQGAAAREYVRSRATWERVAAAHVQIVRQALSLECSTHGSRTSCRDAPLEQAGNATPLPHLRGVNVHGDWAATTGLAHAGRRLCIALLSQDVPVAIQAVSSHAPTDRSLVPREFQLRREVPTYPIDLWTLNLNEFHLIPDETLRSPRTKNYHIGTWYWELPVVPDWLLTQFDRIDEIWAPSSFVKRSLMRYTDKPISIVPTIVPVFDASAGSEEMRSSFGLPRDTIIFLFTFDFNSTVGRKNPMGVIEAFTRAFPHRSADDPLLVIKAINLENGPAFEKMLRDAVDRVGGVLIDSLISAQEMADLFHTSDVYVSLHRSEGFGLGMAEAMAIGKPVIGTAYSGNMDFMNLTNSCLVGYQMRPISSRDHLHNTGMDTIYTEGALWAEPDIGQAAHWMRRLAADGHLRRRIGARAQVTMATGFTSDVVGGLALARLQQLDRAFDTTT